MRRLGHTGSQRLAAATAGAASPACVPPSEHALGRLTGSYAIALRLGSALVYLAVGPLAATASVSGWWLSSVLAVLLAWSVAFAWRVWRAGLAWPVVLADTAVVAALVCAQRQVVPQAMTTDGTTWMLPLASTSVFILQLALRPVFSVPVAMMLAVVYAVAALPATGVWFLPVQALVTATLMTLLRRGGRSADAAVEAALSSEQQLRVEAARRADEREQHRQLHDTILSTLTVIAAGTFTGQSAVVPAQARRDLEVLQQLRDGPGPILAGSLPDLIGELVAVSAPLRVQVQMVPVSLPPEVSGLIAECVAEALRNVARHAGVAEAAVAVQGSDGWVRVEVSDHGTGFDPGSVPAARRGIQESISGRMRAIGGTAEVTSTPGAGTTVILGWPG